MKQFLAYFGMDGSATRREWLVAIIRIIPPLVVGTLIGRLDGIDGFAGFVLGIAFIAVAFALWTLMLARFRPDLLEGG